MVMTSSSVTIHLASRDELERSRPRQVKGTKVVIVTAIPSLSNRMEATTLALNSAVAIERHFATLDF